MTKAKNIKPGDSIRVDGRSVTVRQVEDHSFWEGATGWVDDGKAIHYKGRTKSGVLQRRPDAEVRGLYAKPRKK